MRGGRGARQAFLGSRRRIRGLNPTSLPKEEESQRVNRSTSDRAGAVAGESKAQANDSGGCLVHYAAAPWRASPRGLQGQYGCPERAGLQHTSVAHSATQTALTRPPITHAAAMAGGPQWTVLFVFRTPRRGRLFHGGSCRHAAGTRTCGLGLAIGVFPLIFAAERPLVSCRAIPRPLSTRRVRASAPPPAPSSIAPPPPLLLRECVCSFQCAPALPFLLICALDIPYLQRPPPRLVPAPILHPHLQAPPRSPATAALIMYFPRSLALAGLATSLLPQALAQTWTSCNPLNQTDCPNNPALSTNATFHWNKTRTDSDLWNSTAGDVDFTTVGKASNPPKSLSHALC